MVRFNVTFEIITEESAENGEAEENGFIDEGLTLREALDCVTATDSCHCEQSGIEASDSRISEARWFTVYNGADYLSGIYENRSLHIPDCVTASSRQRIARLLGIRGV
jgi:hypothetical protein